MRFHALVVAVVCSLCVVGARKEQARTSTLRAHGGARHTAPVVDDDVQIVFNLIGQTSMVKRGEHVTVDTLDITVAQFKVAVQDKTGIPPDRFVQ